MTMQFYLAVPGDFSLWETVRAHGWHALPPFSWLPDTGTLRRVEELRSGCTLELTLRDAGPDGVAIEASEEFGEQDRREIAARVRRMLQLDIALGAFHAYCADNALLNHIPARKQGRLLRCPTLWEDAVKVILTTNTTWAQTSAMTRNLVREFGSPLASDSSKRAFPGPERIAEVPADEFARLAHAGYRAPAIRELAQAIVSGKLDLEALQDPGLEADALRKRLLALRGVGPYAAACLMLYLGRPDKVNVDSWARTMVSRELNRAVSDRDVHAFFEPYGEWRGLVYHFYSWKADQPAESREAGP